MPTLLALTPRQFYPLVEQAHAQQLGDDQVKHGGNRLAVQEALDKAKHAPPQTLNKKQFDKIKESFAKWSQ